MDIPIVLEDGYRALNVYTEPVNVLRYTVWGDIVRIVYAGVLLTVLLAFPVYGVIKKTTNYFDLPKHFQNKARQLEDNHQDQFLVLIEKRRDSQTVHLYCRSGYIWGLGYRLITNERYLCIVNPNRNGNPYTAEHILQHGAVYDVILDDHNNPVGLSFNQTDTATVDLHNPDIVLGVEELLDGDFLPVAVPPSNLDNPNIVPGVGELLDDDFLSAPVPPSEHQIPWGDGDQAPGGSSSPEQDDTNHEVLIGMDGKIIGMRSHEPVPHEPTESNTPPATRLPPDSSGQNDLNTLEDNKEEQQTRDLMQNDEESLIDTVIVQQVGSPDFSEGGVNGDAEISPPDTGISAPNAFQTSSSVAAAAAAKGFVEVKQGNRYPRVFRHPLTLGVGAVVVLAVGYLVQRWYYSEELTCKEINPEIKDFSRWQVICETSFVLVPSGSIQRLRDVFRLLLEDAPHSFFSFSAYIRTNPEVAADGENSWKKATKGIYYQRSRAELKKLLMRLQAHQVRLFSGLTADAYAQWLVDYVQTLPWDSTLQNWQQQKAMMVWHAAFWQLHRKAVAGKVFNPAEWGASSHSQFAFHIVNALLSVESEGVKYLQQEAARIQNEVREAEPLKRAVAFDYFSGVEAPLPLYWYQIKVNQPVINSGEVKK